MFIIKFDNKHLISCILLVSLSSFYVLETFCCYPSCCSYYRRNHTFHVLHPPVSIRKFLYFILIFYFYIYLYIFYIYILHDISVSRYCYIYQCAFFCLLLIIISGIFAVTSTYLCLHTSLGGCVCVCVYIYHLSVISMPKALHTK